MNKTVIVTGPECSGSRLAARICSHVLNVGNFNDWQGFAWSPRNTDNHQRINSNAVLHRSTPYRDGRVINVDEIIKEYGSTELLFVFTTRDKNISKKRHGYSDSDHLKWIEENKKIIKKVRDNNIPYIIWSYETLVLYGLDYLTELYDFLGIKSDFIPNLNDGNKKYMK